MFKADRKPSRGASRSPRGERGLKFPRDRASRSFRGSLPSRGAWIEIYTIRQKIENGTRRSPRGERGLKYDITSALAGYIASLPSRGAWIEINSADFWSIFGRSLPSRGAWIEIPDERRSGCLVCVAPLAGSVD